MVRRARDRNVSCYLLIITTFTLDAAQKSEVTGKTQESALERGTWASSGGLPQSQIAKNCLNWKSVRDDPDRLPWLIDLCMTLFFGNSGNYGDSGNFLPFLAAARLFSSHRMSRRPWRSCLSSARLASGWTRNGRGACFFLPSALSCARAPAMVKPSS